MPFDNSWRVRMLFTGLGKPLFVSIKHPWAMVLLSAILVTWRFLVSEFPPAAISGIIVLLIADWLLGTAVAWTKRRLSVRGAYQGVVKLVIYLALVALVNHLARIEGLGPVWDTLSDALILLVAAALLLTEAISTLQHINFFAVRADVEVPVLGLLLRRLEREEAKLDQGGTP